MATKLIETLRSAVPYIARLHRRIDDLQHKLAAVAANPQLHTVYGSHNAKVIAEFRKFLQLLRPHRADGVAKRRFGGNADGGYVMLDDFGDARTAISLGIGDDVSWDLDIADRGLRVVQFDHTVDRPPREHPNFAFNRARIIASRAPRGSNGTQGDVTLGDILARSDVADGTDIIAKIDIEGGEWDVLAQADSAALSRLRQVAIEFHDVPSFTEPSWRRTALAALAKLMSTHVCVHIHGNNWTPFTVIGGIPFPIGFEASFARRADHAFVPSAEVFPTELDRPCNPKAADLYLGAWNY